MGKCIKCAKQVTKKCPGLQCGKCSKWMHATCASITTEQLTTLVSTDAVDWKCRTCCGAAKPRRVSGILPQLMEDDDNTDSEVMAGGPLQRTHHDRFMRDIKNEIKEVIRDELQLTLQFYTDKIDEYERKITEYEEKNKLMERKLTDTCNKMKNLDIKYGTLEQKLNQIEQSQISNHIEICGLAETEGEDILDVCKTLSNKLSLRQEDIQRAYRRTSRAQGAKPRGPSTVTVVLREGARDHWLEVARRTSVTPALLGREGGDRIYIREALTPATAFLLWKAKSELKETNLYKYVWCKNGAVLARKDEKCKVIVIRAENDIVRLAENAGD